MQGAIVSGGKREAFVVRIAAVEEHLTGFERYSARQPALWSWCLGLLAFAAGRYTEAEAHFEASLATARAGGNGLAGPATEWLGKCERAQHEVRHRGKGRVIATRRAEQ